MIPEMQEITKEYTQSFVLEPTKVTRLIDKIHERLAEHPNTTRQDRFSVFLKGNHREEVTSVDQVLNLENSRKQAIQRLSLVCTASTQGAVRPEHEVSVDFAKVKMVGSNSRKIIAVDVRSETDGWVRRTLSEVEEQIERTWQPRLQFVLPLLLLLLAVVIFLLFQIRIGFYTAPRGRDWLWFGERDLPRLKAIVAENRIITDDELREVTTMQLRNLLEVAGPPTPPQKNSNRRLALVAIPAAVLIICIVILLVWCYPHAVFLWGDEIARRDRMLQLRRTLWGIIVAMAVVSVASRLLFEGLTT